MNFLKIKQEFPFKIIEIEHFWIPLSGKKKKYIYILFYK